MLNIDNSLTIIIMEQITNELIAKINNLYDAEVANDFDVINSLGIHENNHSILLKTLLNHNNHRLLNSFVKEVLQISNIKFGDDVEITALKYYIDILIKDKTYAIIIENKICWAKDRYKQLLDYVETVKGKGIKEDNIYAVYLTSDETNQIDYKNEISNLIDVNRFIHIDYKNHLLMWFDSINKQYHLNLDGYISYIRHYIIGDGKIQPLEYKIFNKIYDSINKTNRLKECLNICSLEEKTRNDDNNKKSYSFVRWLINTKLYNNLAALFPPPFYNDKTRFRSRGNELFILFFKKEWKTEWYIHFEFILDVNSVLLRLELHFEQRGKNNNIGKTAKYLKQELPQLIIGSKNQKVYYQKTIILNDDLSINTHAIKDDIQQITKLIDDILINKL